MKKNPLGFGDPILVIFKKKNPPFFNGYFGRVFGNLIFLKKGQLKKGGKKGNGPFFPKKVFLGFFKNFAPKERTKKPNLLLFRQHFLI